MLRVLLASTCIAFVLGSASVSQAARKSRVLSLAEMETSGNANIAPAYEARLHIPGASYVHIRFTLPSDFKRDSVATVRLFFYSSVAGCAVDVGAISARRWRNGYQSSFAASPAGGFTETVGGATPVPDGQGIMFYKDFKLAPATTGSITGQRRNDTVTVTVGRNADTPDDTCNGSLYLITGKLKYEASE